MLLNQKEKKAKKFCKLVKTTMISICSFHLLFSDTKTLAVFLFLLYVCARNLISLNLLFFVRFNSKVDKLFCNQIFNSARISWTNNNNTKKRWTTEQKWKKEIRKYKNMISSIFFFCSSFFVHLHCYFHFHSVANCVQLRPTQSWFIEINKQIN